MRAEHAGRVLLVLADRARVVEQRAQLADADRQIGAQQVLAEVVEEHRGPTGDLRNAVPPVWPGVCQEYSYSWLNFMIAAASGGSITSM